MAGVPGFGRSTFRAPQQSAITLAMSATCPVQSAGVGSLYRPVDIANNPHLRRNRRHLQRWRDRQHTELPRTLDYYKFNSRMS